MTKTRQILEVKFNNEVENTYEYLFEGEAPFAEGFDFEKNPVFAVINRETYTTDKGRNITTVPTCHEPNIYRVVRVVKVKSVDEQEYDGVLQHALLIFTPDEYIQRIDRLFRIQKLYKVMERKEEEIKEQKRLSEIAKLDPEIEAIFNEIKKLES